MEEKSQAAGWVYLAQEGEIQDARMVLQDQFQEAQALQLFVFDHQVAAQVAGTWVYFSPGEGKQCNTKTKVFYFELSLYLLSDCLQMKAVQVPENGNARKRKKKLDKMQQ